MSPSLDRQKAIVLKRTLKSDILGTEGLISCVVLGELLNLIKFQCSSLEKRSTNSTYMFNGVVKSNKVHIRYLGQCIVKS